MYSLYRVFKTKGLFSSLLHSFQVSDVTKKIVEEFGLNYLEVMEIIIAALYHDIGKEYIPDFILYIAF